MSKQRRPYNHPDEKQPDIDATDILQNVLGRQYHTVATRENLAEALRRIVDREIARERVSGS